MESNAELICSLIEMNIMSPNRNIQIEHTLRRTLYGLFFIHLIRSQSCTEKKRYTGFISAVLYGKKISDFNFLILKILTHDTRCIRLSKSNNY